MISVLAVSSTEAPPPNPLVNKKVASAKAAAAPIKAQEPIPLEEGPGVVQSPPRAGRLYEEHRALRVKRAGCSICIGGRRIIRHKRSLDCQRFGLQ